MTPTLIKPQEVVNGGIVRPTPFDVRFDAQLIAPNILAAEQRCLLPILCRDLYSDLVVAQVAGNCNYNTDLPLVNKFTDPVFEGLWINGGLYQLCALCMFVASLPSIAMQAGSNGIFEVQNEWGKPVGISNMKWIIDNEQKNIDALKNMVLDYICRNASNFTNYEVAKNCQKSGCIDGCGEEEKSTKRDPLAVFGIYAG